MTARDDLDRLIPHHYAAEAPARAPDWLLGSVLATVDTTPQRRPRVRTQWRLPQMIASARVAVVAVAVLAVAGLGLALLRPDLQATSNDGSPSPQPSAPPLPTPWTSGPPAVIVEDFRQPFAYVLPAGPEFAIGRSSPTYYEIRVPAAYLAGHPAGVIVQAIGNGRSDPCSTSSDSLPIADTPRSVIDYLKTVPGLEITDEIGVIVSGLPAFQASVRAGPETSTCPDIWPWFEATEPFTANVQGEVVRVVVVLVDKEPIVVTVFGEYDNPTWAELADALVGSFEFAATAERGASAPLWPGSLRMEPGGPPMVLRAPPAAEDRSEWEYADRSRDAVPAPVDIVDIARLDFDSSCYSLAICVYFDIYARTERPLRDPQANWVAYGLVIDRNGDGIADFEVGTDNVLDGPRTWRRDLHTGEVDTWAGTSLRDRSVDSHLPWLGPWIGDMSGESLSGWIGVDGDLAHPSLNFYLWAAVIRDGEIVSTDFAPDAGWLDGYQR